jgi:hypothetical protein
VFKALAIGIMGVLFFILNAIFALIIIIIVIWASVAAVLSKNPDVRYQPMRDDRGSFIKSQNNLNAELDALGATARGDGVRSEMSMARGSDVEKVGTRRGGRMLIDDDATFDADTTNETLVPGRDSGSGNSSSSPPHGNGFVSPLRNESPVQSGGSPWKRGVGY